MRVFSTHSLPLLNLLGATCPGFGIHGLNSSRRSQWHKAKCKTLPKQWLLVAKCDRGHLHYCRGHIYPVAPKVLLCSRIKAQMWCGQTFHPAALLTGAAKEGCSGHQELAVPSSNSAAPTLQPPQPQAQKLTGTFLMLLTGDKLGQNRGSSNLDGPY